MVSVSNFLLYYAKNKGLWKPNRVYAAIPRDQRYGQYIEDFDRGHEQWKLIPLRDAFLREARFDPRTARSMNRDELIEQIDAFVLSRAERVVQLARVTPKDVNAEARLALERSINNTDKVMQASRDGKEAYFFLNGKQIIFYSGKVKEIDGVRVAGAPLTSIWDDLLSNNIHQEGGVFFPDGKKPEGLIKRILEIATQPGDLVLDSFAGSGTTAATAHKMRRKWITIEMRDHCNTHVYPRLMSIVAGTDNSGITQAVGWKGGGGFRYYKLAPSLLKQDKYRQWVVNDAYNAEMLAEAMCKHMGFDYAPSDEVYWMHGHSTETDFIFVTAQTLTHEALAHLSEEVGDNRTPLVCCSAWNGKPDSFPNLTLTKIPNAILTRCEFGHDDYSLQVQNLPVRPVVPVSASATQGVLEI